MILLGLGVAASAIAAWILTALVRRYALRRFLVDIPNHRSSHSDPTPRGGGIAIVTVVLAATAVLTALGLVAWSVGIALFFGAGAVAAIGWFDDHRHVPARWRALTQFVAAGWAVYWIGVPEALWLGVWSVSWGTAGVVLAVFGLVWLTNLFNFMDGIDGIAASEAVTVAAVGGALLILAGTTGLGALALMMAAASAGFLVWNWPPARIFMGDVGSGTVGFLLGTIALAGSSAGGVPLLVWGILLGVFLFDATATLFRRIAARERFFEAHRLHAYQRAVQAGHTHLRVTLAVMALNIILAGLTIVTSQRPAIGPLAVVGALVLLCVSYLVVERMRPMWIDPPEQPGRDQMERCTLPGEKTDFSHASARDPSG